MKEGEPKSKPEVLWSLTQGPPQPNLLLYKERKKERITSPNSTEAIINCANWQSGQEV